MKATSTHRSGLRACANIALALLAVAGAITATAATPIYRCLDQNLGVLYTDVPCKEGDRMDIRAGDADPAAVARLDRERDALDRSAAERIADERRAALQRQYLVATQPAYAPPPEYTGYADAADFLPYGYGVMAYGPSMHPRAQAAHRDRRSERQQVVPAHPRVAPHG